ncbi:MAG: hypothetical protein LH628_06740 [Microcoleus sp. CAN_BIN18]|nr:hypothetical protein [Microcoleus sp. CAN_BIN18]
MLYSFGNFVKKEEGRRKKEEGRRKKEEGRRKKVTDCVMDLTEGGKR